MLADVAQYDSVRFLPSCGRAEPNPNSVLTRFHRLCAPSWINVKRGPWQVTSSRSIGKQERAKAAEPARIKARVRSRQQQGESNPFLVPCS